MGGGFFGSSTFSAIKKLVSPSVGFRSIGKNMALTKQALGIGATPAEKAAAAAAQAEADRVAQEQYNMQQNMKLNSLVDLKGDNSANVVAGGAADASSVESTLLKKKQSGSGLGATLGLNV